MSTERSVPNTSWVPFVIIGILVSIWAAGLRDAILGGMNPGYVRHDIVHPYPVRAVLVMCGIISAESVLLFVILRPIVRSCLRHALVALAVFAPLWMLDFIFWSGWTDQAGWCYSNHFFLTVAVGFLMGAAVLWLFLFRKQPPARSSSPI